MASKLTAVKHIKKVILGHQALVDADGTSEVPASFPFAIKDSGESDAYQTLRAGVAPIVSALVAKLPAVATVRRLKENDPREFKNVIRHVFISRVLRYLSKSSVSIGSSTKFHTRTFLTSELDMMGLSSQTKAELEDSNAIIQLKRIDDPVNPFIYTWTCIIDGAVISRGTAQPFHKMIVSILKGLNSEQMMNLHEIQLAIAELAAMKPTEKQYYWYLSNQDTAQHYSAFGDYRGAGSCMSKSASYYGKTGSRQHPMDAYNNSPDWRLMFISEHSPEEILAMCDGVIANPDAADRLFDYPFLTRSMVLPSALEETNREFATPYVFGKMYGLEKILRYLFSDSGGVHHMNNNPLVTHVSSIAGGRIPAIKSTNTSYIGRYILPYFDQANEAKLFTDADGTWFKSTFHAHERDDVSPEDRNTFIWKGQYQTGVGCAVKAYSPLTGSYRTVDDETPVTINTILGQEHHSMSSRYRAIEIGGSMQKVPAEWTVSYRGQRYMMGQMVTTMAGENFPKAMLATDPTRYKEIEGIGYFDIHSSRDKATYAKLSAIMTAVEPITETVASVIGTDRDGTSLTDLTAATVEDHTSAIDQLLADHRAASAPVASEAPVAPVAPPYSSVFAETPF